MSNGGIAPLKTLLLSGEGQADFLTGVRYAHGGSLHREKKHDVRRACAGVTSVSPRSLERSSSIACDKTRWPNSSRVSGNR
jgi:hypothetical protein